MPTTNNIGYLIQHLATSLARQTDQVLQNHLGIGYSQFKILMVLQQNPHLQQKKIAERLSQTEGSISRQIKLLQKQGLLAIEVSPKNRREHIATPSPKGVKLTERAQDELNSYYAPMFEKLNIKQQQELLNTLTIMHDHACQSSSWCQLNR